MAVVRYKNQSEYAFLIWINNHPGSFHSLDTERFHVFVKTVARYRSKKWQDYSYFKKRVLDHAPKFGENNIDIFHSKLEELLRFYKACPIPTVSLEELGSIKKNSPKSILFQRGVKDGKSYIVEISEQEYYSGGASKETLKKAKLF